MGSTIAASPESDGFPKIEDLLTAYRTLDKDALKDLIRDEIQNGVASFMKMAAAIRILEERGEDMSELKGDIFNVIRKIAHGQIDAQLAFKFQGNMQFLKRAAGLSIPEQKRLASNEPLPVVVNVNGHTEIKQRQPLSMTPAEMRQVFAADHIRDEGEQRAVLDAGRSPRIVETLPVQVDPRNNGINVRGLFISLKELQGYVARLIDLKKRKK